MPASQPLLAAALRPLPYCEAIRHYLRTEQSEVWPWYAAHKVRAEHADAVRFELLKSTYRVERETQPALYDAVEHIARRLGLLAPASETAPSADASPDRAAASGTLSCAEIATAPNTSEGELPPVLPVTIYHAQNPAGLNASMALVPDELHLVLHGPVEAKLSETELHALIAHELSHVLLWNMDDGEYLIVDQVLSALTLDVRAATPHFASARLFRLYNEVFCDRGALAAVGDPLVVVSMLLKVHTQLEDVSAESYLRQADEVFSRPGVRAEELTHPEAFIRARAIKLWADGDPEAEAKIRAMIEGQPALDGLDLLGQGKVAALTRRLLDAILTPAWIQSEPVLAHARLFFEDYIAPASPVDVAALAEDLRTDDPALQDYYCFVLLDFVTADRDLEDVPLAAALVLSEQLGLKERFAEIAQRELRLRKKQFEKIDQDKEALLAQSPGERT